MCSPDPPAGGLLHGKLSLMWGDYKDEVDELTMEMNKGALLLFCLSEELKITLNDNIQLPSDSEARFAMWLSEARSNVGADSEEVKAERVAGSHCKDTGTLVDVSGEC